MATVTDAELDELVFDAGGVAADTVEVSVDPESSKFTTTPAPAAGIRTPARPVERGTGDVRASILRIRCDIPPPGHNTGNGSRQQQTTEDLDQ
jgi:hypothetical protein